MKTKYELGCVNKPIRYANEIMKMYKNTNKKNFIFYMVKIVCEGKNIDFPKAAVL